MSHANAALTSRHRLLVAKLVVEGGYPISEAARFQCSWSTVKRWVDRYLAGDRQMLDRSSRPHSSPNKTSMAVTKRLISLRLRLREGPVQLAARVGIAASTVHQVLGRQQGSWNRQATPNKPRSKHGNELMKHNFVHTVIDDHSRVAYAEVHDDETAATAVAVLRRAVAWFADRGDTVERVLSDNGSPYKSHLWRDVCRDELGIKAKKTRPYRPQTNGKIERFHKTLADGWGYARDYFSEAERREALPEWLHAYNHHRPHSARENKPPITRLTNVPGQYI